MSNTPLVVGITSLPSRVGRIRPTLESLLAGERLPDQIVLALPLVSRREKTGYEIPAFLSEEPFRSRVRVVQPDFDWGPGTKLLGTLPTVQAPSVLVVADDDVRYRSDFLKNLYEAQLADQAASFSHYVYRVQGLDVGQGCDGFCFWTPNLTGVEEFARKFVLNTRLMLHDDLWISIFLAGKGVRIRDLADRLGDGLIYDQVYELNALRNLAGDEAREALTRESIRRLVLKAPLPAAVRLRVLAATIKEELRVSLRRS